MLERNSPDQRKFKSDPRNDAFTQPKSNIHNQSNRSAANNEDQIQKGFDNFAQKFEALVQKSLRGIETRLATVNPSFNEDQFQKRINIMINNAINQAGIERIENALKKSHESCTKWEKRTEKSKTNWTYFLCSMALFVGFLAGWVIMHKVVVEPYQLEASYYKSLDATWDNALAHAPKDVRQHFCKYLLGLSDKAYCN